MANKSDKVRKNTREREGIPQKAPFPASTCEDGYKYVRGGLHVLAGKEAVHCNHPCSALHPPGPIWSTLNANTCVHQG